MNIQVKTFDDLTKAELYELLKLRQDVFIFEQECICEELDGRDFSALHVVALDKDGHVRGNIRLVPDEDQIILGRVVLHPSQRGTGLGKRLMERALEVCRDRHPQRSIYLTAQQPLESYYERFGFESEGPVFYYPKDHIPHVPMRRSAHTK